MAKHTTTRQELRRKFRRNPLGRCGICNKRSDRHNRATHESRS